MLRCSATYYVLLCFSTGRGFYEIVCPPGVRAPRPAAVVATWKPALFRYFLIFGAAVDDGVHARSSSDHLLYNFGVRLVPCPWCLASLAPSRGARSFLLLCFCRKQTVGNACGTVGLLHCALNASVSKGISLGEHARGWPENRCEIVSSGRLFVCARSVLLAVDELHSSSSCWARGSDTGVCPGAPSTSEKNGVVGCSSSVSPRIAGTTVMNPRSRLFARACSGSHVQTYFR